MILKIAIIIFRSIIVHRKQIKYVNTYIFNNNEYE